MSFGRDPAENSTVTVQAFVAGMAPGVFVATVLDPGGSPMVRATGLAWGAVAACAASGLWRDGDFGTHRLEGAGCGTPRPTWLYALCKIENKAVWLQQLGP